jgi:hypothetical protein
MQSEASTDPAIVTVRQPYLFTNELEIGPTKQETNEAISENRDPAEQVSVSLYQKLPSSIVLT